MECTSSQAVLVWEAVPAGARVAKAGTGVVMAAAARAAAKAARAVAMGVVMAEAARAVEMAVLAAPLPAFEVRSPRSRCRGGSPRTLLRVHHRRTNHPRRKLGVRRTCWRRRQMAGARVGTLQKPPVKVAAVNLDEFEARSRSSRCRTGNLCTGSPGRRRRRCRPRPTEGFRYTSRRRARSKVEAGEARVEADCRRRQ